MVDTPNGNGGGSGHSATTTRRQIISTTLRSQRLRQSQNTSVVGRKESGRGHAAAGVPPIAQQPQRGLQMLPSFMMIPFVACPLLALGRTVGLGSEVEPLPTKACLRCRA